MYRGDVPGYVVLEDGTVFSGFGFGAQGRVLGEVVFNTSMSGYQEIVTDPSYHGQMVTFTYPMIGNYGASEHLLESDRGPLPGHHRARSQEHGLERHLPGGLDRLADRSGIVVGVAGVDTRALTRRIREHGAMTACVAAGPDLSVERPAGGGACVPQHVRAGPGLCGHLPRALRVAGRGRYAGDGRRARRAGSGGFGGSRAWDSLPGGGLRLRDEAEHS